MKPKEIWKAKDPDLRGSLAAMRRAVALACNVAIQTDTGIVVVREGKPVRIDAAELQAGEL